MIIDVVYNNDFNSQIVFSYIDENQNISLMPFIVNELPNRFTKWVYADDNNKALPGYISYDNKPVSLQYTDKFNKFDLIQFIMSLPAEQKDKLLAYKPLTYYFFDIETEIKDEFPDAENAKTPIVSIAITALDSKLTTIVLTIDDVNEDDCNEATNITQNYIKDNYNKEQEVDVRIVQCANEEAMLKHFLLIYKQIPSLSGWNTDAYDIPYIKNRMKRYGLKMNTASIDGTLDAAGLPKHKINRDYMQLFKTYDYALRPYESFRLDWVAQKSLKLPKLPYDTTLKQLRIENIARFLAYNAIDTIIVALLHKKHNLYNVLYGLAMVTSLPIRMVEGPVNQSEAVMFKYYLNQRGPNDSIVVCPEKGISNTWKYEGGYVKDPVNNWSKYTACFDYSSLYPSIMRTHNIGPMNLIRQLKREEYAEYENDPKYFISSQGRLYDNSHDCAYKAVESELYIKRKSYQGDQMFYWNEVFFAIQKEKKRRGLIDTL